VDTNGFVDTTDATDFLKAAGLDTDYTADVSVTDEITVVPNSVKDNATKKANCYARYKYTAVSAASNTVPVITSDVTKC